MSAPTLLLVGRDACLTGMLNHELSRAGYCVLSDDARPCAIDCAVVDLDTASPPEGIPYVGCTRDPARVGDNSHILLRPFLVTALLAVLEQICLSAPADAPLALSCSDRDRTARFGHAQLPLMPAEHAVLRTLLAAEGRAVTREELTAALPSGNRPASNLLEVTVCSLRKKLEDVFGIRPIRTVRGIGWRLEHE